MLAVPSSPEGRPIAEPVAEPPPPALPAPTAPTAPTRPLNRNVTPQLTPEEVAAARKASYMKLFDTWNDISHKYGMIAPEEDDEVDLITGEITCDRGRIRDLKPRAFAERLPFVDEDDDDDGLDEEDEGDDSDTPMLPQDEEATPEPESLNGVEEDHPLLQEQPWTAEDDRDLDEFMKVERMRRFAAGAVAHEEDPPPELDMDMEASMGPGQMDVIAMLVRREVERMLGGGGVRPSPPFPHAAARASAGRSSSARPAQSQPLQRSVARAPSIAAQPPAVAKHRHVERTASVSCLVITTANASFPTHRQLQSPSQLLCRAFPRR